MLLIWLMRLFFIVLFFGGAALAVFAFMEAVPRRLAKLAAVGAVIGFFGFFWMMSATYVPGTQKAVVENTASGSFEVIGPGVHVWPLQPDLVPFMSKVTKYSLKQQQIEIGTEKDSKGVSAGSGSAGNPTVYIQARGWVTPNPTDSQLITLHKLYGTDYANGWVERNWVTAVKAVQGAHPYDYLIGNRDDMATEVEEALQDQLLDSDGVPIVTVSQLAITNFDFDASINTQLDEVAKKEFERQKALADIEIARQQQAAQQVQAETRLAVAQKDAESAIAKARGEAEAVRLVNEAITQQGEGYVDLKAVEKWNGELPTYMLGNGALPFLTIP